ncbi:unnamed protein product, partial [marine sediment metagenome]
MQGQRKIKLKIKHLKQTVRVLGSLLLVLVLISSQGLSAFDAHIVNVTAGIHD